MLFFFKKKIDGKIEFVAFVNLNSQLDVPRWLSVWCRGFEENFGDVSFPDGGMAAPRTGRGGAGAPEPESGASSNNPTFATLLLSAIVPVFLWRN